MTGKFFQSLPESGETFGGGGFIAGADIDAETDAEVCHKVTVVDVAGATGLLGVITDFSSLLAAVEGLDRDVDIEDPR
jgi:hypothetical protein